MCGRLFQTLPLARLIKIARANCIKNPEHYSTSYNVCPTTYIPAVKASTLYAS
jgi:putative SOS response-associated peptidase YedK